MAKQQLKLGIMGGGVMGEAILCRLLEQNIYEAREVKVSEPQSARCEWLRQQYGVITTNSNPEIVEAETLLLAIKPQIFSQVMGELSQSFHSDHFPSDHFHSGNGQHRGQLVLSILAGMPLSKLEAAFPDRGVIRAMPNAPATVGYGMTAISAGQHVQPEQVTLARKIFAAIGQVVEVPEYLMDAVTGLSGSGPAYVALMIESLADGGVAAGLPRAIALQLALQTVRGTAELLMQTDLHPALLKDRVTSPGGTTIAGVAALEECGFRSAIIEAVQAAYCRSQELGC